MSMKPALRPARVICLICLLFSAAIFRCNEAGAAEKSVKAAVAVSEEYDDNIFLSRGDRVSDFITRAAPSIALDYKAPWCDLTLQNTFYWWIYDKRNKAYYSDYLNMASKFTVLKNYLYLDVADTYSSVVLEPRGPSTETNLNVNRTDSNVLNVSPYFKYDIDPRNTLLSGYAYSYIWYRQNGIDRQQHRVFLELDHKFTPRLAFKTGAEYLADRPQETEPANDEESVYASAAYIISPKLKVDGTAGYRWITFWNSKHISRLTYDVGISYGLFEYGGVEARANSFFSATPVDGVVQNIKQQVGITYGMSAVSSVSAFFYHREDKYIEIVRSDEAFGVTAGLNYAPTARLSLQVSGVYEDDKYSPQDDRRTIWSASAGLNYRLTPRVALSVTYKYNRSSGEIEADNYFDNVVGIQLRAEL